MGFAPRPVLDPFIYNYEDHCKNLGILRQFKSIMQGDNSPSIYWPISPNPHFFSSNKAILRSLGFQKTTKHLLNMIDPECLLLAPDEGEYDKDHFLQSAFILSQNSHIFIYEISGRTHHVALLFCLTSEQMHDHMKSKNRSSSLWMLDQAVISNGHGQSVHLNIDRDSEGCNTVIDDLFTVLRATNNLAEIGESVEAHTVFTRNMFNMDASYFSHHYEARQKSPKTP